MSKNKKRSKYIHNEGYDLKSITLTEFAKRRFAPFALLWHCVTILLLVFLLIFAPSRRIGGEVIGFQDKNYAEMVFDNPEGGLITFELEQSFPLTSPTYSELEIEILDENFYHQYSAYKDLWQEEHPNGEGGIGTYSDRKMRFQVVLPESKKIHIRAYTGLDESITVYAYAHTAGYFYAKIFMWVFLVVSGLLVIGSAKLGDPFTMIYYARKSKGLRNNRLLKRTALIALAFIGFVLLLCLTHVGYAHGGETTTIPSFFYGTDGVTYLG